jgi:hypothetical protein
MTKSEELAIIVKRLPEQEKYCTAIRLDLLKYRFVESPEDAARFKRLKELQRSADGVMFNLVRRKDILVNQITETGSEEAWEILDSYGNKNTATT